MTNIHPTAIISPEAIIAKTAKIGPFCIVGPEVNIGERTLLHSNVVVQGKTTIGTDNTIYHSAVLGTAPQDLKYENEPTKLIIGNNNTIREFVTINLSATLDEDTTIGDNCLLMAYVHVAHNCHIGNNVIVANAVNFAGHVIVEDFVSIGGMTAVHQFVQIGTYAFVGGASGVKKDIPPFTRGEGMPYKVAGLNSTGLQRKGFTLETIASIKKIYKIFYQSKLNVTNSLIVASNTPDITPEGKQFIAFVKRSKRGICRQV